MNSEELHISSLIVHIRADKLQQIETSINLLNAAELITMSPNGKAVVVLEAPNQGVIMEVIDQINNLDGVINSALVYHEYESLTV
jgi:periplasmic nitrate reductase NapD